MRISGLQPSWQNPLAAVVLLIEPGEVDALLAARVFEKMGYAMEAVSTGKEAYARLDTRSYDAIILEPNLHDMSGFKLMADIRRMEEQKGNRRTPVIALTSLVMRQDKERCLKAGMDAYLPKPVREESLRKVLEEWSIYMPSYVEQW